MSKNLHIVDSFKYMCKMSPDCLEVGLWSDGSVNVSAHEYPHEDGPTIVLTRADAKALAKSILLHIETLEGQEEDA